jgi:CHAT domain-containing protein
MSGVPVEAWIDESGKSLTERFAISYVPSATVYAWLRGRREPVASPPTDLTRGLFVGDPPFAETPRDGRSGRGAASSRGAPHVAPTLRGVLAGNPRSFAALPPLAWSRREVSELARWFEQATLLVGPDASEQKIAQLARSGALSGFSVLHFATHALVDPTSPQRSALVLSQLDLPDPRAAALAGEEVVDGLVTAREIMQTWQLSADLVVLSACETALGRNVSGEGYVGFCHAFFQAGARSVIASLWKVDDEATALVMESFYRHWRGAEQVGEGVPVAEALRRARLDLRDHTTAEGARPFAHPSYWAGFVLFGEADP